MLRRHSARRKPADALLAAQLRCSAGGIRHGRIYVPLTGAVRARRGTPGGLETQDSSVSWNSETRRQCPAAGYWVRQTPAGGQMIRAGSFSATPGGAGLAPRRLRLARLAAGPPLGRDDGFAPCAGRRIIHLSRHRKGAYLARVTTISEGSRGHATARACESGRRARTVGHVFTWSESGVISGCYEPELYERRRCATKVRSGARPAMIGDDQTQYSS